MNYNSEQYGFEQIKAKKLYKPKIKTRKKNNSEKSLIFSKIIISALEEKIQNFNKNNKKQIQLPELKKAYKTGFNNSPENINKETWARVNLFLRISQGDKINFLNNLKYNLMELSGSEFVIKGNLVPEEIDYKQAEEDIKKYKLEDFDFKNPDELYLEDEEDRVCLNIE